MENRLLSSMKLYDWPWSLAEIAKYMECDEAEAKLLVNKLLEDNKIRTHEVGGETYYELP